MKMNDGRGLIDFSELEDCIHSAEVPVSSLDYRPLLSVEIAQSVVCSNCIPLSVSVTVAELTHLGFISATLPLFILVDVNTKDRGWGQSLVMRVCVIVHICALG
jgi:hypothetical protein